MKTLNQRVNELIKLVISDESAKVMNDITKRLQKDLDKDTEYLALVKAANDYKLKKYAEDEKYITQVKKNLRITFHAASKTIKDINLPFEYIDDERIIKVITNNFLLDTDAKLAACVCKFNERLEKKKKVKKEKEYIPLTDEEIKQINTLVDLGILTEEEGQKKIDQGKVKK